jgi:hypothetical protein
VDAYAQKRSILSLCLTSITRAQSDRSSFDLFSVPFFTRLISLTFHHVLDPSDSLLETCQRKEKTRVDLGVHRAEHCLVGIHEVSEIEMHPLRYEVHIAADSDSVLMLGILVVEMTSVGLVARSLDCIVKVYAVRVAFWKECYENAFRSKSRLK